MSDRMIHEILCAAGARSGLFTLDERRRLVAPHPERVVPYLVSNRITAIVASHATIAADDLRRAMEAVVAPDELARDVIEWHGRRAIACLAARGIRCALVKGPLLAAMYPVPATRPFTDIDLFVDPEDVAAAEAALVQLGLVRLAPASGDTLVGKHAELQMRHAQSGATVDVHWDLVSSRSLARGLDFRLGRFAEDLRACATFEPSAREFSPELLLVYLVSHHVLHHRFAGLLWLIDILLLLEREPRLDWQRVIRLARSIGLDRHVYFYAWAIARLGFGTGPAEALRELRPSGVRFHVAMRLCPPERIFAPEGRLLDMQRRVFREAFKVAPRSTASRGAPTLSGSPR